MKTLPPPLPNEPPRWMRARWRLDSEPPRPAAGWSFYAAFTASTLLHLALLVIGAGVFFAAEQPVVPSAIEGAIAERKPALLEREPLRLQQQEVTLSAESGRATSSGRFRAAKQLTIPAIQAPLQRASLTPQDQWGDLASVNWAQQIGAADPSAGAGDGNGAGAATGLGFFKVQPEFKTVVFVVDASNSMNRPHQSQWKTRFRRVKAELVHAVSPMKDDQQFFIIFFNDKAIPMPARSLQRALPSVKRHYLHWVSRQQATGRTDPRAALGLALRLRPDAIYFLTDGVFGFGIRKQLLSLKQSRVAIHTFAFGNPKAEDSMKEIAENNGGKYVYVR